MPERDTERLEIANALRAEIASGNTLTPVQARSFVRGLQTAWEVPTIQWGVSESKAQFADAKRLVHAGEIFRKVEGESSSNATLCYRRAGELLEWLSRSGDDLQTFVPLPLLAAGCYQLGGLPAMAAALLSQMGTAGRGEKLYARFLQGDFDRVIRLVLIFWRRNRTIATQNAAAEILNGEGEDKVTWYFTVELVRALGSLADTLRRGDSERFDRALAKLTALDNFAIRAFNEDASILVSLLRQVATAYGEASIYGPVRQLSEINPARRLRLELFARTQFNRRRGILWTSQKHGLARLLQESSFALCTPTGSGKTLVANLALLKELLLRPEDGIAPLALYLVPSRALAGEVEAKLTSELGRDLIITGLYGGADWGVTDYWLTASEPTVLIATVEKADALMRYLGPLLSSRLRLLIVDEAHQVVPEDSERTQADFAEHSNRSIRLESFVSRLLAQSPNIVRMALTAVAGGASLPVARWIEGRRDAEAIGTHYRSTRQIVGVLETEPDAGGRMLLELLNGRPLFVRGRDEPVYIRLRTSPMPQLPARMRNSLYRFNGLDVLWTSLHLAAQQRRILISVAQQPEQTMGWYKEALELPSWQEAAAFQLPSSPELRARFDDTRAACIDYCGEDSYEVALLDRGIATNHGQMPQRLRRLMTELIDREICPITVATATLTEGVNLPFDIIFLTALKRRSFDPINNQPIVAPMSTAEFRNLAGRAGRPGASNGMEGITLVAIPRRPSATARGQLLTQRRQIRELRSDYAVLRRALLAEELEQTDISSPIGLLLQGIADRASDLLGIEGDAFLNWLEDALPEDISADAGLASITDESRLADSLDELDSVLLSALEELRRVSDTQIEGAAAEAALSDLWQKTFTAYAAVQEEWLERAFIRRGRAILDVVYPDKEERSRLYQYGFTPHVGRRFETVAPAIRDIIAGATNYGIEDAAERLSIFGRLGAMLRADRGYGFRVRATQTDQTLLENWQDVLAWWMQGPDATSPEPDELRGWQRFVADNLDFRLGVAVGAVVARAWSRGAGDPLAVPSLAAWRETTGLPWFGFWIRELLRWGTLDPFVAFSLAQGLAQTRETAATRRAEFETWLRQEHGDEPTPEDFVDPQLFLEWQRSLDRPDQATGTLQSFNVELTGTTGERGMYRVIPIVSGETINWLDAAGYVLARSPKGDAPLRGRRVYRDDFELHTDKKVPQVRRVFSGR